MLQGVCKMYRTIRGIRYAQSSFVFAVLQMHGICMERSLTEPEMLSGQNSVTVAEKDARRVWAVSFKHATRHSNVAKASTFFYTAVGLVVPTPTIVMPSVSSAMTPFLDSGLAASTTFRHLLARVSWKSAFTSSNCLSGFWSVFINTSEVLFSNCSSYRVWVSSHNVIIASRFKMFTKLFGNIQNSFNLAISFWTEAENFMFNPIQCLLGLDCLIWNSSTRPFKLLLWVFHIMLQSAPPWINTTRFFKRWRLTSNMASATNSWSLNTSRKLSLCKRSPIPSNPSSEKSMLFLLFNLGQGNLTTIFCRQRWRVIMAPVRVIQATTFWSSIWHRHMQRLVQWELISNLESITCSETTYSLCDTLCSLDAGLVYRGRGVKKKSGSKNINPHQKERNPDPRKDPKRKEGRKEARKQGRKQGRKEAGKEGSKEGRKQGRKEGSREGRKEARQEGKKEAGKEGRKEAGKGDALSEFTVNWMCFLWLLRLILKIALESQIVVFWLATQICTG